MFEQVNILVYLVGFRLQYRPPLISSALIFALVENIY